MGIFLSKRFNFPYNVSTALANLICYKDKLPQGAPTSPIVSNIICWSLDESFTQFAKQYKVKYTRYADDITLSSRKSYFPDFFGKYESDKFLLNQDISDIILKNGFSININKVRLMAKKERQVVTGITINEKPNITRKYFKQIRAMLYSWNKVGLNEADRIHNSNWNDPNRSPFRKNPPLDWIIGGKINFIKDVKGKNDPIYLKLFKKYKILKLKEQYFKSKTMTPQQRGLLLEIILNKLFELDEIKSIKPFTRRNGRDQIDGAFKLDGGRYLLECKWVDYLENEDIDQFYGDLGRSGNNTLGLLISIEGWNEGVVKDLKENREKNTILMNGQDLEDILGGKISITRLLQEKIDRLAFYSEPYLSSMDAIKNYY